MSSLLVVHYETSDGTYKFQKVGSTGIANSAITSALIAAGAIGTPHIAAGSITSGLIAANVIATPHIANQGILSASIGVQIGAAHFYTPPLTSGYVIIGQGSGITPVYGAVPAGAPGDNTVTSSKIASGQVGDGHIYPASIISGKIAANIIATPHIANQGLLSSVYGAASIGGVHIATASITSGKYGAASINEGDLVSGISIDISELAQEPNYRAAALVSAFMAVQFSASGYFNLAQPNSLATMPALGLLAATVNSGSVGTFQYTGRMTNTTANLSGVANWNFSGYEGDLLFLISGGYLGRTPPVLSGDCIQRMGKIVADTTIFVKPELFFAQLAE